MHLTSYAVILNKADLSSNKRLAASPRLYQVGAQLRLVDQATAVAHQRHQDGDCQRQGQPHCMMPATLDSSWPSMRAVFTLI